MKLLDAGTEMLDDRDVLKWIKDKRKQHTEEDEDAKQAKRSKTKRPGNYMRALEKHEEHLENPERPFKDNANYDENEQYLVKLMRKLKQYELTKPELLMLVNHRPYRRSQLEPMIEDIDTRYTEPQKDEIVAAVVGLLGMPALPEDTEEVDGGEQADGGA